MRALCEAATQRSYGNNRPLVNRNHAITSINYTLGFDAFRGTY